MKPMLKMGAKKLRDAGDYSLEDVDVVAMLRALRKGDPPVIERVRKRLHAARDKALVEKELQREVPMPGTTEICPPKWNLNRARQVLEAQAKGRKR